eukprot:TRINITY_DN1821_c0_g1_i1.p1 TRINITY_DN1821_c0_g1~~TRINITY_DN1821_c0_g1_i1.p1  ORF type:complete len:386 (+),score=74.34 TRINITY_DN1821_c0_g1_i1:137-1159(+)
MGRNIIQPLPKIVNDNNISELTVQIAADNQRLKELAHKIPYDSDKSGKIMGMLGSQQAIMLKLAEGLNKYNEDKRIEEINDMTMKLNAIQNSYMLNPYQSGTRYPPRFVKKEHKKESKLKLVSEDKLNQLKVSYLGSKERKETLLRSLQIDPSKKEDFKVVPNPELKNANINQKFSIKSRLKAFNDKKIPPFRKFKAIAKAIARILSLRKNIEKHIQVVKKEQQLYLTHDISLHLDIARAWLLKAMKLLITSIINDQELNMSVANVVLNKSELNTRVLRIQVRVKAVVEAMLANTESPQLIGPLFKFLQRLMTPRKFIPDSYLTRMEKANLTFDSQERIA